VKIEKNVVRSLVRTNPTLYIFYVCYLALVLNVIVVKNDFFRVFSFFDLFLEIYSKCNTCLIDIFYVHQNSTFRLFLLDGKKLKTFFGHHAFPEKIFAGRKFWNPFLLGDFSKTFPVRRNPKIEKLEVSYSTELRKNCPIIFVKKAKTFFPISGFYLEISY